MTETMTTEELAKMMADQETVKALRKVVIEKRELTKGEEKLLLVSPYIEVRGNGTCFLTSEGRDVLGDEYTNLVEAAQHDKRVERYRQDAHRAVNDGFLEVVDGHYQVTPIGRSMDSDTVISCLCNKKCGAPFMRFVPYDGIPVGEESKGYHGGYLNDTKWWRMRKKLLYALSEDEKRLLGLPTQKPLNREENSLLSMISEYCQSVKPARGGAGR